MDGLLRFQSQVITLKVPTVDHFISSQLAIGSTALGGDVWFFFCGHLDGLIGLFKTK